MRRLISTLAVTSCFLSWFPAVSWGQTNPGVTLFSGVQSGNQLPYRLDFGGAPNQWDRYHLRIPAKKMKLAVAEFAITYPKYYRADFDTKGIEVRVNGKKVPLQEVKWDKDNHVLELDLQQPVPADKQVDLVFSNIKNPAFGGTYYFNCEILSPGDVPLRRYIGTWILTLGDTDSE
ncbi:MAG: DUF2808 domain-containing protein [Chroococcidiopsidaceae cyanobacterium CP_BM_RX_35]|nr:DUF2808 domain-containing protein [Chroococcidiopsidaceae cyanobacterium CP_BM_RX_35]